MPGGQVDLFGEIRHLRLKGGTVVYDPRPDLGLSVNLLVNTLTSELNTYSVSVYAGLVL